MINVCRQYFKGIHAPVIWCALIAFVASAQLWSKQIPEVKDAKGALSDNFPRVVLSVKEQYVDPNRVKPAAMLAAILESLELRISKLVVGMPKSLTEALERSKKGEGIASTSSLSSLVGPGTTTDTSTTTGTTTGTSTTTGTAAVPQAEAKEQIVLDLGGTKKIINYEPIKSIWGMIFLLRDIFKFVEVEAKKQGLLDKKKNSDDPIDWEKIESAAINAMLSTLDPHSVYLEPKYARDLTLTTKGEFGGVGIVISIRDGFLTVISPIDGTPAARAGVKAKDRIVKIDEDSAINMPLEDAVTKLRGAPNSSVNITVQRGNDPKNYPFELKRSIIKVDSVAYALMPSNVGYLRIKAFQGNTAVDVKAAIMDMKKKSKNKLLGLVLDLRDNPGGLLREAITISDFFLDGGEIVSTQGAQRESRQVEMATPGELDPKLKIAVLVNGGSASASEIVAGAIKYGDRGIVVGDAATFGKGSVQMLFDFPSLESKVANEVQQPVEPAALKLTIAQYYAPKGRIIQALGIMPDILLSAAHVDKPEELSLFHSTSRREIDLEAHLDADKGQEEKTLMELNFLAPRAGEEGNEYGKLNLAQLKNDFAVSVASDFIVNAKGPLRKDLLVHADTIKTHFEKQEQKKIIDALKKHKIDWSLGKALQQKDALKVTLKAAAESKAGEKLKLTVGIKNTSTEPVYQVHALTHSKTDIFNQRELLFGKLNPNQEIERSIIFDIPKDVVTRKDLLTLEVRDVAKEKLSELNIPVAINGLNRPRLAHLVYVDDEKSGNGDGNLQVGEEVNLVVWLKNIGDGKAFEPTVVLKNESGSKVFLKTGRETAGELLPNQETSMKFSFRVKEPTESADFEIQVFDGQMHDIWREKISLPLSKEAHGLKKKLQTVLLKTTNLYAQPNVDSVVRAQIKDGMHGESIGELDGFYLVKIDKNLLGYVKKADVRIASADSTKAAKNKLYTINYDRVPAKIDLKFGDGLGWTKKESGEIIAELAQADRVSEVLLYVNGKKVLYKALTPKKANEKISQVLSLKPGVNVITLLAREDANYGQRENLTVYYDDQALVLVEPPKPEAVTKVQTK